MRRLAYTCAPLTAVTKRFLEAIGGVRSLWRPLNAPNVTVVRASR